VQNADKSGDLAALQYKSGGWQKFSQGA